ncbi:MAG: hypothetical protein K6L81_01740 [Agarilytica sp.]
MIITLTDDEVRDALLKAASEKTQHVLGNGQVDNLYFDVVAGGKDVEDIEQVQCSIDFG